MTPSIAATPGRFAYLLFFLAASLVLPLRSQASATATAGTAASAPPARTIVARVNGQPIFEDQLEPKIRAGLRKYKRFNPGKPLQAVKKSLQAKALEEQIIIELFYQEGQRLDIPDAEKKIAQEVAKRKKKLSADKQEIDDEALWESARRRFYVNEYLVANDLLNPQVPEEKIRAYYDSIKNTSASKTDTAHVRHILIEAGKDATAEEHEQARKKIEHIRQLIQEGMPFDKAAEEYSQDTNASAGGDLGYIQPGYMPPEFEKVAFSLGVGKTSDVIKTQFGYHLLEVLDFRPKGSPPRYEDTRAFFEKYLRNELIRKKMGALVRRLKEKAEIEILL
ncbi:MAG TPA: hypothetical protein ENI99_01800 [Sedimenticola sp.]|nr:hypothetical protein [Sedimenticola sp.]